MDQITITDQHKITRLDKFLADEIDDSRSTIQVMIQDGYIQVNKETVKRNYKIKVGDVVTIRPMPEEVINVVAEDIPLTIVYEDKDVLVINKQNGLVVHPGAGHPSGTLVNALLYHVDDFKAIKGEIRPGIVHRIDKETTGLLVVAKTPQALEYLSDQMKDKTASRTYLALVDGVIPHNVGKITAPIGRDPKQRQRMAVVEGGKDAVTHFRVLQRFEEHTLIECKLETGRTHQIRVHMNYIQYPIVGDPTYGRKKTDTTNGQFLHATSLGFVHPTTEEEMMFECELPAFFQERLDELK